MLLVALPDLINTLLYSCLLEGFCYDCLWRGDKGTWYRKISSACHHWPETWDHIYCSAQSGEGFTVKRNTHTHTHTHTHTYIYIHKHTQTRTRKARVTWDTRVRRARDTWSTRERIARDMWGTIARKARDTWGKKHLKHKST